MGPSNVCQFLLLIFVLGLSAPVLAQNASGASPDGPICFCNSPTNYILHCTNYNPDCDDYQTHRMRGPNFCSCKDWGPPLPPPTCCRLPVSTLVIWGLCDITQGVAALPVAELQPSTKIAEKSTGSQEDGRQIAARRGNK